MQRLRNDWYATVGQLIREFEDGCNREAADRKPADRERRSMPSRSRPP